MDGVLYDKSMRSLLFYPTYKEGGEYAVPEGVYTIELYAFERPVYLKRLVLPDSLRSLSADQAPGSISEFVADGDFYVSVDGVLFTKDKKTLVKYPGASERIFYTIPEGTEIIDYMAFYEPINLKALDIPDSVIYVDNDWIFGSIVSMSCNYGNIQHINPYELSSYIASR